MQTDVSNESVKAQFDKYADAYASAVGHDIPPHAEYLYKADLLDILGTPRGRTLEVAVGTGLFTALLDQWGFGVTGIDFSPGMLRYAQEKLPHLDLRLVDDMETMDDNYFAPESFELVIGRQATSLLGDPVNTFRKWRQWLVKGGRVALIDALWSRSDWTGEWQAMSDKSPLACTQTWTTLCYLLEQADFKINRREWLHRINGFEAVRAFSEDKKPLLRFIVVAEA